MLTVKFNLVCGIWVFGRDENTPMPAVGSMEEGD